MSLAGVEELSLMPKQAFPSISARTPYVYSPP
jgi:hypothetical protein